MPVVVCYVQGNIQDNKVLCYLKLPVTAVVTVLDLFKTGFYLSVYRQGKLFVLPDPARRFAREARCIGC